MRKQFLEEMRGDRAVDKPLDNDEDGELIEIRGLGHENNMDSGDDGGFDMGIFWGEHSSEGEEVGDTGMGFDNGLNSPYPNTGAKNF
jgi:hypothetical protein